jgi:hypothetical protein
LQATITYHVFIINLSSLYPLASHYYLSCLYNLSSLYPRDATIDVSPHVFSWKPLFIYVPILSLLATIIFPYALLSHYSFTPLFSCKPLFFGAHQLLWLSDQLLRDQPHWQGDQPRWQGDQAAIANIQRPHSEESGDSVLGGIR